ncbi:MAB_1171c family putative transporter [Lentzea sp. JNUCC 0626]|uniref:MAB_1171c family putative transporter n=1 Tax=Lentzea sp. JNUCC 0626 TaxID=3367513 RepID=UPI003747F699
MIVNQTLHITVSALFLALVIYRFVVLMRQPRNPARWGLWGTLAGFVFGLIVGVDIVFKALERLVPGSPWWLQHVLLCAGGLAVQIFFIYSIDDRANAYRRARWWTGVYVVFQVAITALYVPAYLTGDLAALLRHDFMNAPLMVFANLVFVGYVGLVEVTVTRLSWTWSKVADRVWLRRGLRLIAIGSAISVLYAVHKVAYVAAVYLGHQPPWSEFQASFVPALAGVVLITIGSLVPRWGARYETMRQWRRHYRSYQRLAPLWTALVNAFPEVQLEEPYQPRRDGYRLDDLRYFVYRRVIEIWDARRALRPYTSRAHRDSAIATARAAGLTDTQITAAAEAASVAEGLRVRSSGQDRRDDDHAPKMPGGSDLAAEVAWLEQVADAFARAEAR